MAERDAVIALVGNPNVGKSTIFNALTGGRQHTGNWTGKTVDVAYGRYTYKGKGFTVVDLPGTYSLASQSEEERVTEAYLQAGQADLVLIVGDATILERNLYLALQVFTMEQSCIFCVNLMDEADRRHIQVNLHRLEASLGIPVVGTSAGSGQGIQKLKDKIFLTTEQETRPLPQIVPERRIRSHAREIFEQTVSGPSEPPHQRLDRFLLGSKGGYVVLLCLLLGVLWLTLRGANGLSRWLSAAFAGLRQGLVLLVQGLPDWCSSMIVQGLYDTVTDVIAVMLPPMLLFFPLFSFLEDLGYLPRAAFLMDRAFQGCGGCGKQTLTMAMGLGCNAVGITGCRIISSPKERLIAILTNSLVPCNGRFPTLLAMVSLLFREHRLLGAACLLGIILLPVAMTFGSTALLHRILPGREESAMILEIPPFRRPQVGTILKTALRERTLYVLARAVLVAAPAGIVIWLLQYFQVGGLPLIAHGAEALDPLGRVLGMNGVILTAFLLAFPANELMMPLAAGILSGAGQGVLTQMIDPPMALCILLFTMFHWPCGTACLTIKKETGSWKWVLAAMALPTLLGCAVCSLAAALF